MTAILLVSLFYGCGPSAEDVLKKYESYAELTVEGDRLPVSFEIMQDIPPVISYSSPLISGSEEHVNALAGRWFVADAMNPEVRLPVKVKLMTIADMATGNTAQSVSYGYNLALDSIEAPFLLVGFEGIAPTESKEATVPPLFFLVENRKEAVSVLTPVPRAAGDLFTATYTPMFFSEQTYSGEVPFENAKNVKLEMTLSPDLKQATKLTISGEKIKLTPAHFDKQRKKSDKESIFKYSENSAVQTSFAITTVNGYNTVARDASGYDKIESLEFEGGFETTDSIDIAYGKIILDERPFICDLTVTNACIFGQVKFELDMGSTKSVYAVFKNITTPQNIPEEILKKQ